MPRARPSSGCWRWSTKELAALPTVYVFGAGHVGRALAAALALLPVRAVLVDGREEELWMAPAGVERMLTPLPGGNRAPGACRDRPSSC